jgi:hypothetical protein
VTTIIAASAMHDSASKDTTPDPDLESYGKDVVAIVAALLAWGLLFAAGLIIDSTPYRTTLGSTAYTPFLDKLRCWFVVITTYTLPNVALLACLASILGAAGHRLKVGLLEEEVPTKDHTSHLCAGAVIGGFFVYLVALSGILILVEKPWANPSAEQYARLAGFISLLSFLMGYSPRMLSRFLARVAEMIEGLARRN